MCTVSYGKSKELWNFEQKRPLKQHILHFIFRYMSLNKIEVKKRKEKFRKGELKSLGVGIGTTTLIKKKIEVEGDHKKELEATTAYKVAQKVRVKRHVMVKAKKIKETAYDKDTGEIKEVDKI